MTGLEGIGMFWALGAGLLAPGWLVVRWLDLGRSTPERLVVAIALGRVLLGVATLLATTASAPSALHAWPVAFLLACLWLTRRQRADDARPPSEDEAEEAPTAWMGWPLAAGLFATALLVGATVGRSGMEVPGTGLVFFGRDVSFDPLAHVAATWHLIDSGLPLEVTFVAGTEFTNSYLPYGVRAGFHLLGGVPLLELTFRALPFLEVFALAATTAVLTRSLGGGRIAATAASLLVVLGSGAELLLLGLGAATGKPPAGLDSWSFFGPYLLGANSITPALQTWFAALLLLRRLDAGRLAPAVVAGALVASLFEIKLFLWAAALPTLMLLAVRGAPAPLRRPFRVASLTALALSIPSLLEKAWWAERLAASGNQGFGVCIGCLPRYLLGAAVEGELPPFSDFARFQNAELLRDPTLAFATLAACLAFLVLALGSRLLAIPELWRGAGNHAAQRDAGRALVCRVVAIASCAGLFGALVARTSPHFLNASEFAWVATFGLWPFVALAVASWWHRRRWAWIAVLLLLALPATARTLVRLGYGAPVSIVSPSAEVELLERFREISQPGDVVFEPSIFQDREVPSPITWIAGRSVYITNRSATATLPEEEANSRYERVGEVFFREDPDRARSALAESGAGWVYAPVRAPLPPALLRHLPLEVALASKAGTIYRVERSDPKQARD